jgi:5-hydroxyisourate hydrolase
VSGQATVSTHVLDVSSGKPASGVRVTLGTRSGSTDADGRIADLSGGGIELGSYRLVFAVGAYFGARPHLYESIALDVRLDEARHYHVPLLIAPFSCSSYRGT